MADHFTEFSCILPVGSVNNVAPALALYRQFAAGRDAAGESIGFEVEAAHAVGGEPDALWLRDSVGDGDPEHVIAFALLCAETFSLSGRWGFVYSTHCSRHRLDGFDGGAHLLDLGRREIVAWLNCEHWLALQLAADEVDVPSMEAELLALLKEPAQPMGLSERDFRHWLRRAQAAIARAETTPRPPAGGTRPASTESIRPDRTHRARGAIAPSHAVRPCAAPRPPPPQP